MMEFCIFEEIDNFVLSQFLLLFFFSGIFLWFLVFHILFPQLTILVSHISDRMWNKLINVNPTKQIYKM